MVVGRHIHVHLLRSWLGWRGALHQIQALDQLAQASVRQDLWEEVVRGWFVGGGASGARGIRPGRGQGQWRPYPTSHSLAGQPCIAPATGAGPRRPRRVAGDLREIRREASEMTSSPATDTGTGQDWAACL